MTRHYTIPIVREIFPPQRGPSAPPDRARRDAGRQLGAALLTARRPAAGGKAGER